MCGFLSFLYKSLIKCPTCRNEYTVNSIKRNITLEKLIENIKTS